eukprot:m.82041 g.82041  ORF g.82041 m.82041 type:complete len:349 (-) comp8249_c0_seq2:452-1498(-)
MTSRLRPHVCSECGRSFVSASLLETHKRIHSGERPFVCVLCDKAFSDPSTHRQHVESHLGGKSFQCHFCGRTYGRKSTCDAHIRKKHPNSDVSQHPPTPAEPPAFAQQLQSAPFVWDAHDNHDDHNAPAGTALLGPPQPGHLVIAGLAAPPDNARIGPLALDPSTNSATAETLFPELDHGAAMPHEWDRSLGLVFSEQPDSTTRLAAAAAVGALSNQQLHSLTSQEHRPDTPEQQQQQQPEFRSQPSQLTEPDMPSGALPATARNRKYACPDCDAVFSRSSALSDHRRRHTGERPFACDECQQTFVTNTNLNRHKRATHRDERPHSCMLCGRRFRRPHHLERHKLRHH